jgi:hypothetical protein
MEESVRILTIKPARNGFLVYVNEDFSQGTITRVPYVFESMASLQNFIRESLEELEPRTQSNPCF